MLQRAARNAYSWWWASHIRTKQSKWLDDNLQDMEEKVEYMLKIVDDDGDSFRQRAEMYYRKRPELINLVEEAFRGYRALAERYDHLSKELQNANRTIASIYPERVQLHMDEEEGEDFPPPDSSSPPREINMLRNNFPDAPKLDIPKPMVAIKNTGKRSSRLISKKGARKESATDDDPSSGLSKSEALKEIDKLQKTILAFQTEKEFVKSSYVNGVAKYWEIENQVTEMQAKVSNLQDEFGVSLFIEDDEARTLMTATALKSCQETLARLQQKQKESAMAALCESQKVQEVREKFRIFKEEFQRNNTTNQSASEETMNLEKQIDFTEVEKSIDVEALRAKIKEELQGSSSDSLSATELADKVDELVDKVIKMECEIASQNAYVKKLESETNLLQEHLESLQQENESSIENSDSKNNKIRDLEEGLRSIQSLKQYVADGTNNLQTNLTEASCNLDDLSQKLQNVKPDEDVHEPGIKSREQFQDSRAPDMALEADDVAEALQDNQTISKVYVDDQHEHIKGSCDVSSSSGDLMSSSKTCGESEATLPKQGDNDQIDFQFEDTTTSQPIQHDNTNGTPHEQEGFNPFVDTMTSDLMKQDSINGMPKQPGGFNPFDDVYKENDVVAMKLHGLPSFPRDTSSERDEATMTTMSKSTAPEAELLDLTNCSIAGNVEQVKRHDLFQKVYGDPYLEQAEFAIEGDQPNWKELFLNGIDDREKILVKEYTSILRSYKEVKAKLNEVEKKKRAGTFQHAIQVKLLRNSNAVKDAEIQSLYKKLNSDEKEKDNVRDSPQSLKEPSYVSDMQSPESNQSAVKDTHKKPDMQSPESNQSALKDTHKKPDMQSPESNQSALNDTHEKQDMQFPESNQIAVKDTHEKPDMQSPGSNQSAVKDTQEKPDMQSPGSNQSAVKDTQEKPDMQSPGSNQSAVKDTHEKQDMQSPESNQSAVKDTHEKPDMQSPESNQSALKDTHEKTDMRSPESNQSAVNDTQEKTDMQSPESNQSALKDTQEKTDMQSPESNQTALKDTHEKTISETADVKEESTPPTPSMQMGITYIEEGEGEIKIINVEEPFTFSTIEEKIRMDIDDLLEENIEFWLRFSTSFHQIQKFQNSIQDLKAELTKLRETDKEDSRNKNTLHLSDVRPIYRHLREIQTELSLWLDHNVVLKDDLANRLSSLSSIQEEIARLSSIGSEVEEGELSPYQAAKFQGEIMNMKQENNKIANELDSGLSRVKNLQVEIQGTLNGLDEELGITKTQARKARIPLRSFLFGVKLKKRQSIFSCVTPSLQKQSSDVGT